MKSRPRSRRLLASGLFAATFTYSAIVSATPSSEFENQASSEVEIRHTAKHDLSNPLVMDPSQQSGSEPSESTATGNLPGNAPTSEGEPDKSKPSRKKVMPRPRIVRVGPDQAAQRSPFGSTRRLPFRPSAPTSGIEFDSIGDNMDGFNVNAAPPDTSMAVGPTQIVVMVNAGLVIHDKSGTVLFGPIASNVIWDGFGGDCEDRNDGDGVVRYDRMADRWVISQFAVGGSNFYECVAVSKTNDATGEYWRYAFQFDDFPDYPKLSVWPDAYYISYNMFDGFTSDWIGSKVCATDREAMLVGASATQVCFSTSTFYGGLLAADVDSAAPPPDGAPNTIVSLGFSNDELAYWNFDVDFDNPGDSIVSGPTALDVDPYIWACYFEPTWNCIDQKDTSNQLDALDDRLMNRLAYQNFGTHQSMVVTHSVVDGSSIGIRWYELRMPAGSSTPTVYQTGTYVPDTSSRWMGSAAQNQNGDIAIGYSKSSTSMYPAIAFTGRLVDDPLDQMPLGETIAQAGGGSQTGVLNRWGDYATMNIDPADDCTFWFATEYLPVSGTFNWATHVASFTLGPCEAEPTFDFDLDLSEDSVTLAPGASTEIDVTTNTTSGDTETVAFEVDGLPSGMTATFSPNELEADGTSTLEISTSGSVVPGTYSLDVTASAAGIDHTATLDVTVTDFNAALTSASGNTTPGGTLNTTLQSTFVTGYRQNLNLTASGLPAGVRVTFNRSRISAGARSTVRISTSASTPPGEHELTITATGTRFAVSKTYTLTVSDFSVDRDPASLTMNKSTSNTLTIDTEVTDGPTQPLTFSLVRPPRGVTGRFTPSRINAGGSATLTLSVSRSARAGTYTITVAARGSTVTKTTTFSLTINP